MTKHTASIDPRRKHGALKISKIETMNSTEVYQLSATSWPPIGRTSWAAAGRSDRDPSKTVAPNDRSAYSLVKNKYFLIYCMFYKTRKEEHFPIRLATSSLPKYPRGAAITFVIMSR